MSDQPTPMTDAAAFNINPDGSVLYSQSGGLVGRDTCETLERQLAEAKEAMQAARMLLNEARRDYSAGMNLDAYERIQEAINHLTP